MKLLLYLLLFIHFCLMGTAQLWAAVGDVNYISDVLNVPLRSGPSSAHRIIHRGLPSGTHLTVMATDEEAGFTQVRTDSGMEGWVRSQYLVGEPIARVKLSAAQKRLQSLKTKFDKEREEHENLKDAHKEIETTNKRLNSQVEALAKELEELKRISADPINEHARNVELNKQNTRLHDQVGELSSTIQRLEANVQREWMLIGGTLVLVGLLLGVWIKARPRKTTYSSRYN